MRRLAVVAVVVFAVSGCTGEPPFGRQRPVALTVCDVVTEAFVRELLADREITDAGCTADRAAGISARQAWQSDGLTISAYTTDRAPSATAPDGQRCRVTVSGRKRSCMTTDDAAVVHLGEMSLVATVTAGAMASSVSSSAPAAGPFLVDYATAVAEALTTAEPTTTPKVPRATRIATETPAPPPQETQRWEPLNTAKCVLHASDRTTCASIAPAVEILFDSRSSDTGACSFGGSVTFGDGTSAEYRIPGGVGLLPMTTHTYATPGTYAIVATAKTLAGSCWSVGATYVFTLQNVPTPATCEHKFDPDRGRSYLYTMLPAGTLKDADGKVATTFEYSLLDSAKNVFTDEAGVRWTLMSDFALKEHQPAGWTYLADDAPYRKFMSAPDSRGGSFEAVLMPDSVAVGTPFRDMANRALTYTKSNWLAFGPGMPTYNLVHPAGVAGNIGHLRQDWYPHMFETPAELASRRDDRYVAPTHVLDPRTTDWQHHRERVEALQEAITDGFHYDPATGAAVRGTETRPVPTELRWLAEELQACVR